MSNISLQEYQQFCKKTAGKFESKEFEIFTWGLGITGEAGDVASCIKKTFAHKNDKTDGIKENLGDTLWYITAICNFFGWGLQEVIDLNVNKLKARYPEGFTIEKAKRRMVDWNEGGEK